MARFAATHMRTRLHKRLLSQLVLVLLVPTVLVGLFVSTPLVESRRAALLAQAELRATQASTTIALLFDEQLRSASRVVQIISARPVAHDQGQLAELLHAVRLDAAFDCLAAQDAAGKVLIASGDCSALPPEPPVHTPVFLADPAQGLVASVSAALPPGAPAAWLAARTRIDRSIIAAIQHQPDLELSLLYDGQVVATSLPSRLRADLPLHHETIDEVMVANQSYLAYAVPLRAPDGTLVAYGEVLLPLAPVRAAQRQVTVILLGGVLAALALAAMLGWLLARRISQPIQALGRIAEAVGRGVFDGPITIGGPAEVQQLGATIERMRTQLAQSHAALAAEQRRYASILESVEEAVLTLDSTERITSLNRGGERMLGWDRDQALGHTFGKLVCPVDGQKLLSQAIPRSGPVRLSIENRRQQRLTVSATRAVIRQGRTVHEQIIVLRDVSEDATVRQLKDAFLANVTHEFRTPLAALIASIEILRESDEALTSAERRQMIQALQIGVQRLDGLVQNLLDSASIEAGYFRIDPEPSRLLPLVDEAIEVVRPLLIQRSQQIQLVACPDLPEVLADGRRLVQALVNLLANANKFGPQGDTIAICIEQTDHQVAIHVTDHGPGLTPGQHSHIFERFLRPNQATLRAQGAGLGLAVTKAIVERHGGTIQVESEPDHSTTFTIRLMSIERN